MQKPKRIDTIVVSHQHDDDVDYETIKNTIIEQIIKPLLIRPDYLMIKLNIILIPRVVLLSVDLMEILDLTGRKIIVDTYGGMGRHGGGAFSGKDPSKVDRSAAYMARYIAKNVVATGLCINVKYNWLMLLVYHSLYQLWWIHMILKISRRDN